MKKYIRSNRYDNYFGETMYNKYHKLVRDSLAGQTVSKLKIKANSPGGLIYEAEQLGIDFYDLLECLEGMCYNGEASEIDDSTYLVKNFPNKNRITSSTDLGDGWYKEYEADREILWYILEAGNGTGYVHYEDNDGDGYYACQVNFSNGRKIRSIQYSFDAAKEFVESELYNM